METPGKNKIRSISLGELARYFNLKDVRGSRLDVLRELILCGRCIISKLVEVFDQCMDE